MAGNFACSCLDTVLQSQLNIDSSVPRSIVLSKTATAFYLMVKKIVNDTN